MNNITDKAVVEEAAKYCRLLLTSLQPYSDDVMTVTLLTLCASGNFFLHAFELTNNPEFLDESIDVYRGILEVPRSQWLHFWIYGKLIQALWSRFELSKDLSDFDEIMRSYPIAVTNTYGKEHDRFKISCEWALFSRIFERSSTSTHTRVPFRCCKTPWYFPLPWKCSISVLSQCAVMSRNYLWTMHHIKCT